MSMDSIEISWGVLSHPRVLAAIAWVRRDIRLRQLVAEGCSYADVARRLAEEGHEQLTRQRIRQIVLVKRAAEESVEDDEDDEDDED